ncbi:IgGFc-binding protein-like [Engraulis encrasicolus]|uniref:IgGFc-binding protein-like n=1 Tax=Engraulis encrasicolus TaxID=184585 RepID=UPI002FCE8367
MKEILLFAVTVVICGLCSGGPAAQSAFPSPFKLDPSKDASTGTCWVFGDPHYRTFDGHYYDFMGNCTYTLAKNCHEDREHPGFDVEIRNENQAELDVTFIESVIIKVAGYNINMIRSEFGFVRVDDNKWSLPVSLGNGKVHLSYSGMSVVVESDFGLRVQYNWGQYLVVSVPRRFMGRMCGMCGNYDGNSHDDLVNKAGDLVSNVQQLGKSWQVAGADVGMHCQNDCTGRCAACESDSEQELLTKEAETFCENLTKLFAGPLSECGAVIEPKMYWGNCLHDVCMGKGMKRFLCDSVQVFTDACQQAGYKVLNWRAFVNCPRPQCPENSHYEECGSACPATCGDPEAPRRCQAYCAETCTCDEGFVRNGDKCIPQSQCGCFHAATDSYVPAGTTFWNDDNCRERCTCNGATNKIECEASSCVYGKLCEVVDGIRQCVPNMFGTCMVSGDPHYLTFDGLKYNFQGTCVYQMAKMCSANNVPNGLLNFEVNVQNEGSDSSSTAKLVEIKIGGLTFIMSKEHKGKIMVDGELLNMPFWKANNTNYVFQSGFFGVVLVPSTGLRVQYDWEDTVVVTVPSDYSDNVCGLCGNYNYKQSDDMVMSNGKMAASTTEFGKSWRVAEIPGCVDGCHGPCPNCDITEKWQYETSEFCGMIRDINGPFRKCHAYVNPEKYFESCLYDVCLHHGERWVLCQALKAYTYACQREGAEVFPWRSEKFCDVQCPSHSHYQVCAKGCPATCSSLFTHSECHEKCHEGCACNRGYVQSGDKCVPIAQCGCWYEHQYYKQGKVFYPHGKCEEECTCKDGMVTCKPFSCGAHEKCEVRHGKRGCYPIGHAKCSISGDPHYNTFDNLTYPFQGTCTYMAAKACHIEGDAHLQPFSVVVENEKWYGLSQDPQVAVAKAVVVKVYGQTLVLRKNLIGVVVVNEVLDHWPLNLNDGQIQVYQSGTNVIIETDFGLKVTYDLVYHITITVPDSYRDKTCGLCGNFNGNKDDEFQLPSGKEARTITEFGAAWKEAQHGVVCDDGCTGDFCPKCPEDMKKIYENDCKTIKDPKGPFAACLNVIDPESYFRDCVYDVCMGDGDRNMLCHSIAAYVSDCQDFGVDIKSWRTPTFCPLRCSSNSHYQVCAETCDKPCPGLQDVVVCPNTCAEGCSCDSGYYYNGTGCVSHAQCGCFFEGHTYEIHQSVVNFDCTERYTCTPSGVVKQERIHCRSYEVCSVKDGIQGCYAQQCSIKPGGEFTLADGHHGIVHAAGTYEMVRVCSDHVDVDWFRVMVSFQPCGRGVKCVTAVYVFFDDLFMSIDSNQEAWVNGRQVSLPSAQRHGVSIRMFGDEIVIEKPSVLRVSYSSSRVFTVTVGEDVKGPVCGTCTGLDNPNNKPITQISDDYMKTWLVSGQVPYNK